MKLFMYAGMAIALFVAASAQAAVYPCPAQIDEEPRTAKPRDGFEGWDFKEEEDEDHTLTEVSLYSGHPMQRALLKPDNGNDRKADVSVWTTLPDKHGYWLMCAYEATRLTYVRKVDATKQCKTMNDKKTKKPVGLECH